jgi:hypothetical protein
MLKFFIISKKKSAKASKSDVILFRKRNYDVLIDEIQHSPSQPSTPYPFDKITHCDKIMLVACCVNWCVEVTFKLTVL